MDYVKQRPFWGWGLHDIHRQSMFKGHWNIVNKGSPFTIFIVKFGIVGIVTYLLFSISALWCLSGFSVKGTVIGFVIWLMVLNGEPLLSLPLGLSLMFLRRKLIINNA